MTLKKKILSSSTKRGNLFVRDDKISYKNILLENLKKKLQKKLFVKTAEV